MNTTEEIKTETPQTPHDLARSNETRRGKHNEWALIGMIGTKKGPVPIWRYDWEMRQLNTKYPPQKLRALRKERGVGSSKKRLAAKVKKYNEELTNQT